MRWPLLAWGIAAVTAMLREKIAPCRSVIHVAGLCYGAEPRERAPGEPRRSYTQQEYHIARELAKPVYTFVCLDGFPYLKHGPESEEHRALQQAHRDALRQRAELYYKVRTLDELLMLVLAVPDGREAVEKIARESAAKVAAQEKELHNTRGWLKYVGAAAVAALVAIGLFLWWKHERDQRTEQRAQQAEQRAGRAETQLEDMRRQLERQTTLAEQVLAKIDRATLVSTSPADSDPTAAARVEVAREQGISVDELKQRLGQEGVDVQKLLVQIDEKAAAAAAQATQWTALKRDALTKLSDTEFAAGRYREAIDPRRQILALLDREKEPVDWAFAASRLSNALLYQGHYPESETLAREVLEICERKLGNEDPATLIAINNLAVLLDEKSDYAEAELLHRRALEARERTLGKEHPSTLQSVNNLANLLKDKRDYTGSESLHRRALEARERTLGKEHPDSLSSMHNLANLLRAKGDYVGAEPLYWHALEAQERIVGRDHPDTLKFVTNVATLLYQKRDLSGAEPLFRRALEGQERMLGKEHPLTLSNVGSLACVLRDSYDFAGAEALFRRALEAQERTLGIEHSQTLENVSDLATLLMFKGDYVEAELLFRRSLEVSERALGKEHPDTLDSLNNLAVMLDLKGDKAGAESLLRRALEAQERRLGIGDLSTVKTAYALSALYKEQGRLQEALVLARQAVAGAEKCLPKGHPHRVMYERRLQDLIDATKE